jgi:hypothetical protein
MRHYIVYYEFLNEVRRREIDNSTETCRLFEDVKLNADEIEKVLREMVSDMQLAQKEFPAIK